MRTILTLCVAMLLLTQFQIRAYATAAPPDEEIMMNPEVMPSFEGGNQFDFIRWMSQNMAFPKKFEGGWIVLSFVIEKDGKLTSPKILRSPDKQVDKEILRALKTSPQWTPGIVNEVAVHTQITIPTILVVSDAGPQIFAQNTGEIIPTFKGESGGGKMFHKWIGEQLCERYITERQKNKNINLNGRVVVEFSVETDGNTRNAIVRSSTNGLLATEVVQIIRRSPKWTPGFKDGVPVKVILTVPVTFEAVDPPRTITVRGDPYTMTGSQLRNTTGMP